MKLVALHYFLIAVILLFCVVYFNDRFREGYTDNTTANCNDCDDKEESSTDKHPHEEPHIVNNDFDNEESSSSPSSPSPPPPQPPSPNDPVAIPEGDIPPGDEDLYVLKSEIVPPVCPACPQPTACPRQKPCAPCPPCARCPEPSFECKKVPNYDSHNADLPKPVLNDFSQFGN
tara:strand:- start:130 stop:651 length:522 start_codon:yes stop_codon:yes gene_type:complete